MTNSFGDQARDIARQLTYTEYDAEETTLRKVKQAGDNIDEHLHEPRLDELCAVLDLNTSNLDDPATAFTPYDLALAGWSNWGAGSFKRAATNSTLSEGEFITLNDYLRDIVEL